MHCRLLRQQFTTLTRESSRNNGIIGHLQLILGPMFSGKTNELLRRMRRYKEAKLKCMVVISRMDTTFSRDDALLSSLDRDMLAAGKVERLAQALMSLDKYDVIGIDEGQFFPDLSEFCDKAANKGKIVIVAALDATFERKPFGGVCDLIPKAENVVKLNAVCKECGADAAFTKRIVDEQDTVLLGGSESYKPLCRQCFCNVLKD